MKRMTLDDVMNNKDYTMIMDGTAPIGMAKFRHEPTQEIVYVVVNEALAKKATEKNNTNATVNNDVVIENAEDKEDNTQATSNNAKEEKKMAFGERWMKSIKRGQSFGYQAAKKIGYGVGYATETVKDEVAYAMNKVSSTKVAQGFISGYYNGKSDAEYAFVQRANKREKKAREKAEAKAAMAAAEELFDEFEDEDFDF